jgi:choline kinase
MKAIVLAAGRGLRLFGAGHEEPPKALLEFSGKTLLRRHVETLRETGVRELVLVTGYRADLVQRELEAIGAGSFVRTAFNPRYEQGAVVSLWMAREELRSGDPVLYMDADVLYAPEVVERLIASPWQNCLVFDEKFEPGEDPVMLCLSQGSIVEFGKQIGGDFERVGEWPGLLKLDPPTAARLADALDAAIAAGDVHAPYEPAMREVILGDPPAPFGIEDVSDLPWIEIDFPEDLERARTEITSRLCACRRSGRPGG